MPDTRKVGCTHSMSDHLRCWGHPRVGYLDLNNMMYLSRLMMMFLGCFSHLLHECFGIGIVLGSGLGCLHHVSDMKSYTGWMYQSVSHSSYACLSTSVCMEWDHHICRRCACRSRRCLAVVICILLFVDNLPFLVTDLQQLAEGHSLLLARQHGTVCRCT